MLKNGYWAVIQIKKSGFSVTIKPLFNVHIHRMINFAANQ